MASKSAERCKLWREKRRNDAEYRERERQRKRDARRKRTAEEKQHDRTLGKSRQRKFRKNAKKKALSKESDLIENVDEANENSINVDAGNDVVYIDNVNIEEIPFTESSDTNEDIQVTGNVDVTRNMSTRPDNVTPVQVFESNKREFDSFSISNKKDINAFPERSIWSKMDDDDCHAILQNVNTNGPSMEENTLSITAEETSIRDQKANRRKAYFQALQTALLRIDDFDSIKSHCSSYSKHIDKTYPIEDLPVLDGSKYLTDHDAISLYPHGDAPCSHVPIQTVGDGNCLPRVGSLFAFGTEEHHVEIRVRIFMELCRFEDTYVDNSFLNRGMSVQSDKIAIAYASYSGVFDPLEKEKCRFTYRQYVKNILKTNSFNSIWSIFALASILGVQINSIYPSYGGFNVRDHLHRQVMPRILRHNNRTIHIMWTSTQGKRNSPITWTPNHFVAVLPTQDAVPSSYGLDDAGSENQTTEMQIDTHQHGSHTQEGISDSVSRIVQMDMNVDSPTSALLRYAELESSTVHVTDGDGQGMADCCEEDNSLRQDKEERFDSADETFEVKRRQGGMCSLHPTEELLYLCSTCNDLPICYKCHLQTHRRHDLTDFKVRVVNKEERYLREITSAHEKLLRDANQRKRALEDDLQQIKRKIKDMETFYKQQIDTWTRNQTDIVN